MRALSAANSLVQVTGTNLNLVYLAIAWALRSQVLAASDGTAKMQEIAAAVQEGAAAYLARQFKTLSYFVVIVFVLLFALPGDMDVKIGRSIFFIVGAAFSAIVGYQGMWLAVRANVRVAEAAREGSAVNAVQILKVVVLALRCLRCSCALVEVSSPRLLTLVLTWLEKLKSIFQKMILATLQPSQITLAITSVTALVWPQTYLNRMP
jgi:Na+/H+-translocating membrane pyrophosphatase